MFYVDKSSDYLKYCGSFCIYDKRETVKFDVYYFDGPQKSIVLQFGNEDYDYCSGFCFVLSVDKYRIAYAMARASGVIDNETHAKLSKENCFPDWIK